MININPRLDLLKPECKQTLENDILAMMYFVQLSLFSRRLLLDDIPLCKREGHGQWTLSNKEHITSNNLYAL